MTLEISLSEEEGAALDRYVEEGCYDRDKIVKRWILERLGLAGPASRQRPRREDHRHPAAAWSETVHTHPIARCIAAAEDAAKRGLPDDPAIYA
jgi:hypothetical protein